MCLIQNQQDFLKVFFYNHDRGIHPEIILFSYVLTETLKLYLNSLTKI